MKSATEWADEAKQSWTNNRSGYDVDDDDLMAFARAIQEDVVLHIINKRQGYVEGKHWHTFCHELLKEIRCEKTSTSTSEK